MKSKILYYQRGEVGVQGKWDACIKTLPISPQHMKYNTHLWTRKISIISVVLHRKVVLEADPHILLQRYDTILHDTEYEHFLLQVFWAILLFDINVVLRLPWWSDVTIVQSDITIVVPWQLSTGSKHDYLFSYCSLVGILYEVLRMTLCCQTISLLACHYI